MVTGSLSQNTDLREVSQLDGEVLFLVLLLDSSSASSRAGIMKALFPSVFSTLYCQTIGRSVSDAVHGYL